MVETSITNKCVKFAKGKFENLPQDAKEVKMYMVPGDATIYIVEVDDIPRDFTRYQFKNGTSFIVTNDLEK